MEEQLARRRRPGRVNRPPPDESAGAQTFLGRLVDDHLSPNVRGSVAWGAGVFAIGYAILLLVSPQLTWLPSEKFTASDGSITVGYELRSSDGVLLVLEQKSRQFLRIPEKGLTRRYCTVPDEDLSWFPDTRSMAMVWARATGYDKC
jgi:hypothetical protein